MNKLTTLGRIVFSIPFLVFGIMHFMNANQMAGLVPIPGGAVWIYITGFAQIAAAISLITKIQTKLAMLSLAFMLLIFIVTVQIPLLGNPQMMQMAIGNLLKDTGLIGASLFIAGNFATEEKKLHGNLA